MPSTVLGIGNIMVGETDLLFFSCASWLVTS